MSDLYKVGAISRLTGFSPELLRAWERRYGLLKPVRGKGGQRLYTSEDLRLLQQIRRMLSQGRSIGELAALGRQALLQSATPAPAASPAQYADELERIRAAILDAAVGLDPSRLEQALDEAFARVSPEAAIQQILEPVAHRIGALWASGRCSIAGEHLVSGAFTHRLRRLLEAAAVRSENRSVITACFPDEWHELGILVVAYLLARQGVRITHLGPALPFEDLRIACQAIKPEAVVLSVTSSEIYRTNREALVRLASGLPEIRWIVGGQGVPDRDEQLSAAGVRLWPPGTPLDALTGLLP